MRTLPKTLLAERGKLGSPSACLIDVFLLNSLATGIVVILHTALSSGVTYLHMYSNIIVMSIIS